MQQKQPIKHLLTEHFTRSKDLVDDSFTDCDLTISENDPVFM